MYSSTPARVTKHMDTNPIFSQTHVDFISGYSTVMQVFVVVDYVGEHIIHV